MTTTERRETASPRKQTAPERKATADDHKPTAGVAMQSVVLQSRRWAKTDLRIRPIYHRLRNRIEAHICISFTAYCIYKELERVLYEEKSTLSLKKAAELSHNMYQVTYTLPESKQTKTKLLNMDEQQAELYRLACKKF